MSSVIMSSETMETAPFDPRFPNQNQTKYVHVLNHQHCIICTKPWMMYIMYNLFISISSKQ